MPVDMKQVVAELDREEPQYERAAAALGEDALPHLAQVVKEGDALLASKAAYLAAVIGGRDAVPALEAAVKHDEAEVRVAAAAGAGATEHFPAGLLGDLLDDDDAGVRKNVLRSIAAPTGVQVDPSLRDRMERLAADDPHEVIQTAAREALASLASRGSGPSSGTK